MPIPTTLIQQFSGRPIQVAETVFRGSAFDRYYQFLDCQKRPLSIPDGVTLAGEIRTAAGVLLATLTADWVDRAQGSWHFALSTAQTNALPAPGLLPARSGVVPLGLYDVVLTADGEVLPIIGGAMSIGQTVTGQIP